MADQSQYDELTNYLRGLGHTQPEIEQIMARVRQYDVETRQDSIMDAIGIGTLDIEAIIEEVLGPRESE
jgi:hypothetical protein